MKKELSPEGYTFIIDSISSAFAVATWASKQPLDCIYECKIIDWRKADYIKLFDIILSDVKMKEKIFVDVPHPYFLHFSSIIQTIRSQRAFINNVIKILPLNNRSVYCSCSTSSVLIANKKNVKHVLIDEGMGSVLARHYTGSHATGTRLRSFLKQWVAERILPFRFKRTIPQVTLTNDNHSSIMLNLDYRNFNSHLFETAVKPLIIKTNEYQENVLVLVKGPSDTGRAHVKEGEWDSAVYIDFNINAIKRFIENSPASQQAMFYLKTHPSLGKCPEFLEKLINSLADLGITACGVVDLIDFEESSSLPAEGLLRYGKFQYLLASDVSSSLWNVAHWGEIACFSPLEAVIEFSKIENSPHENLYRFQYELNKLMGGYVRFF